MAFLSPLQKFNSFSVAITTKEIIELYSYAKTENLWNEIFLTLRRPILPTVQCMARKQIHSDVSDFVVPV